MRFYWPGMRRDVRQFIASCHQCQLRNKPPVKPAGKLQSIQVEEVLSVIGLDYLGPISRTSRGNLYVIVAVCLYSKFIWAKAVSRADADSAALFLLHDIGLKFAFPSKIICDRGKPFLSKTLDRMRELLSVIDQLPSATSLQRTDRARTP